MSKIPANLDLSEATDEYLETLKNITDDDLLRASQSLDLFAVVESNRRLRVSLQKEESVIKSLTWVLVVLTLILVVATLVLIYFEMARHDSNHSAATKNSPASITSKIEDHHVQPNLNNADLLWQIALAHIGAAGDLRAA